uniref:Uncharacterized protein n=1 Tax=Romanomermis culicivorax TaxID=13658 RepID=A0A915HVI7_ROMCU
MRQTLSTLLTNTSAQDHGLPTSESDSACVGFLAAAVVSAPTPSPALPLPPWKYVMPVNVNPSRMPKTTGDISMVSLYRPTEGTPGPQAHFAAQRLQPKIPMDSALEVVRQMESVNLLDSPFVTYTMGAVWSMDLAKKYLHLPWVLLNEPLEVEVLRAADVALSAPAALQILGPEVARRALEFILDGTIRATLVDKILLDGEPSWLAVDTVRHAVEQAGPNAQNPAVVAALPSTTKTAPQTLVAIALQQPVATAKPLPTVANAFGETLGAINDNISIIEASPFPAATAPRSPKIGVLCELHPCMVLIINFTGKKLISSHDDGE